jgi:hypothetical protein
MDRAQVRVNVRGVDPVQRERRQRSVLELSVAGITPRSVCLKIVSSVFQFS